MLTWQRSALLAFALFALSFLGFALYADTEHLLSELARFGLWALVPALLWSLLSYLLRAVRFQLFLRSRGIEIGHAEALLIFLSGMSVSATPGKVGEILKSMLLKWRHDVALGKSVPIVVVERVSDLIALLVLAAWGAALLAQGPALALALLGFGVGVAVLACSAQRLTRARLLQRLALPTALATRATVVLEQFATASRPKLLAYGTFLGLCSWTCQVMALSTVVHEFGHIELQAAAFAYCAPLLAGVVTLLPGGLGVTEVGLVQALQLSGGSWATPAAAASVTLLVRLATFWFAIAVGALALLAHRRCYGWTRLPAPELAPAPLEAGTASPSGLGA